MERRTRGGIKEPYVPMDQCDHNLSYENDVCMNCDEPTSWIITRLQEQIDALRQQVAELEGEGNLTHAQMLMDWWNSANIQGVARMEGIEMKELHDAMAAQEQSDG